jgi:hypothetical protein
VRLRFADSHVRLDGPGGERLLPTDDRGHVSFLPGHPRRPTRGCDSGGRAAWPASVRPWQRSGSAP